MTAVVYEAVEVIIAPSRREALSLVFLGVRQAQIGRSGIDPS
jgi:hypothetical protein